MTTHRTTVSDAYEALDVRREDLNQATGIDAIVRVLREQAALLDAVTCEEDVPAVAAVVSPHLRRALRAVVGLHPHGRKARRDPLGDGDLRECVENLLGTPGIPPVFAVARQQGPQVRHGAVGVDAETGDLKHRGDDKPSAAQSLHGLFIDARLVPGFKDLVAGQDGGPLTDRDGQFPIDLLERDQRLAALSAGISHGLLDDCGIEVVRQSESALQVVVCATKDDGREVSGLNHGSSPSVVGGGAVTPAPGDATVGDAGGACRGSSARRACSGGCRSDAGMSSPRPTRRPAPRPAVGSWTPAARRACASCGASAHGLTATTPDWGLA